MNDSCRLECDVIIRGDDDDDRHSESSFVVFCCCSCWSEWDKRGRTVGSASRLNESLDPSGMATQTNLLHFDPTSLQLSILRCEMWNSHVLDPRFVVVLVPRFIVLCCGILSAFSSRTFYLIPLFAALISRHSVNCAQSAWQSLYRGWYQISACKLECSCHHQIVAQMITLVSVIKLTLNRCNFAPFCLLALIN